MFFTKRFAVMMLCNLTPLLLQAQLTTGSISGNLRAVSGEKLVGANIKLQHEPTGNTLFTQTNTQGIFHFENLAPGGPYSLQISFIGYRTLEKKEFFVALGESLQLDLLLEPLVADLQKILVIASRKYSNTNGSQTIIDRQKMEELPAGRNLYNLLASLSNAKPVAGNEGAISFAGQNNRYNTFYIDGAQSNDVFGLSSSGTNGGQTAVSPVPLDAVEQLQVTVTPYDASLGNFTGAAINAVTRSGGNRPEISFYHFTGNGKPGDEDPLQHTISRATNGLRWQGPIVRNKLFYFINTELFRENVSHVFSIDDYKGSSDLRSISILQNNLESNYHYNTGSFFEAPEETHTARMVARLDWQPGAIHRFSFSGRFMQASRTISNSNTGYTLHAANDGYQLSHTSWSGSLEWKMRIGNRATNRLSLAYTRVRDDRGPNGEAFPRVRIYDGDGSIVLGTDISSTINLLQQQNWVLTEKFSIAAGKHLIGIGLDAEYNRIHNAFVQNSFGNYSYRSLNDFLNNTAPVAYQLGFSLVDSLQNDDINGAADFSLLRYGIFLNDEINLSRHVTIQLGLRWDRHSFLSQPVSNGFVNDTAIPVFKRYYDLQDAASGMATIASTLSPRLGFQYKNANSSFILRIGAGVFNGRAPLAWPAGVFQYNGIYTGGYAAEPAQLSRIRFRADPYRQWQVAELGAAINKEPLNLLGKDFRMPSLFRTSLSIENNFRNGWKLWADIMFSKNLSEIVYTNINLLPPADTASGADHRNVYSIVNNAKIPLRADGSNPFGYVILLGNQNKNTGYSWQIHLGLRKLLAKGLVTELNYSVGDSYALHDGTSSLNLSQWRSTETVDGRNSIHMSRSDFSPGHQLNIWLNKKFSYAKGKMGTTVSLQCIGRSGASFSYVYAGSSMVRDDGNSSGYELVYIPRGTEVATMYFLPLITKGKFYTQEQQRTAFETFISNNEYLSTHRGRYAERNGSRMPLMHTVNLKLTQDIALKFTDHLYRFQISCALYNIGNLVNRYWGLPSFLLNDQYQLLEFAGYAITGNLLPQYRFDPFTPQPYDRNSGTYWGGEIGIRITL
jgi:hypothetical protein